MTDTAERKGIAWDAITPVMGARLRPPKKPERPSDGAIALAQRSFNGSLSNPEDTASEILHVLTHRFKTVEEADAAEDELKRAGAYTDPESTVTVVRDPEDTGDKRIVSWRAGQKRGRRA